MEHHKSLKNGDGSGDSRGLEDDTLASPKFSFESDAEFLRRVRIEEDLDVLAAMLDWEPAVRAVGIRLVSRYLVAAFVVLKRVAALEEGNLTPRQKQLAAGILANDISQRRPTFVRDVEGIAAFAATLVS